MSKQKKSTVMPSTIDEVQLKGEGGLRRAFLFRTLLTTVVLGIVFLCAGIMIYTRALQKEMRGDLSHVSHMILTYYDDMYPGDYNLVVDAEGNPAELKKGDTVISDDTDFVKQVADETNTEITIFFSDWRMVTTIKDTDDVSAVGTIANNRITNEVMIGGQENFYNNVEIGKVRYCAQYNPIYSSNNTCIGMIGVARPYSETMGYVYGLTYVYAAIIVIAGILAALWMTSYTSTLVKHLDKLKVFLGSIAGGHLDDDLDQSVLNRDDEIGDMGRCSLFVRGSLKKLVERDPLTNLNNRRSGNIKIDQIRKAARKYGQTYSIGMGDIDHFKRVNDTYGHDAGDAVLKEVARILSDNMAGKGTVIRWGGEEFLFIFEDMKMPEARDLLWNILYSIRDTSVVYGDETIRFTMSYGVVEGNPALSADSEITAADGLLYYAKEHGRNRVCSEKSEVLQEPGKPMSALDMLAQIDPVQNVSEASADSDGLSRSGEADGAAKTADEAPVKADRAADESADNEGRAEENAETPDESADDEGRTEENAETPDEGNGENESNITGEATDSDAGVIPDDGATHAEENSEEKEVELWDIYDSDKQLTGRTMVRNDFTMKDGDYHLTVLGAVVNRAGQFLVTRRVMSKSWAPGWWEISGGAAKAGETSRQAVIREIREETGLDVSEADGGYMFTYRRDNPDEGDNYFVDVYRFVMDFTDEQIQIQKEEADGYMIATPQDITELGEDGVFLHYDSIKEVFRL